MSNNRVEDNSIQQLHLQLVASDGDQWRVRARLKEADLDSMDVTVAHLRTIKHYLSQKFNIPVEALVFAEVTKKEVDGAWLYTTFLLRRTDVGSGDPQIRMLPGIDSAGREYPDMSATLDVFPLDANFQPITIERLKQFIAASQIDPKQIVSGSCDEAFTILSDQKKPVVNHIIAKGRFPESGNDAVIETLLDSKPQTGIFSQHISLQRVMENDTLCRKYPADPGKASGCNVRGEVIRPVAGWDIDLIASDGVELRSNGNLAVAKRSGSVEYRWAYRNVVGIDGEKVLPVSITVSVVPIRVIEAKEAITLATDEAVDIIGTIKSGSEIMSSSTVTIRGEIENDVKVSSQANIIVTGNVKNSVLLSDQQIVVQGDIAESNISAREDVTIQGSIRNSKVHGETIVADTFCGSSLIAHQSVRLKRIDTDESGMISTIALGAQEFNTLRVQDNEQYIAATEEKLHSQEAMFGDEILEGLTAGTVQSSFVKYLSKLRRQPDYSPLSQQELLRLRNLLESIPATRMMLLARKQEKISLERQIEERNEHGAASLIIDECVNADVFIRIDNAEGVLSSPIAKKIEIRANVDGSLEITE